MRYFVSSILDLQGRNKDLYRECVFLIFRIDFGEDEVTFSFKLYTVINLTQMPDDARAISIKISNWWHRPAW